MDQNWYRVQDRVSGLFKTAGTMWGFSKIGKLWTMNHFKSMLRSAVPGARRGQMALPFSEQYQKLFRVERMDVVMYELKEVSRMPLLEWIKKEGMK